MLCVYFLFFFLYFIILQFFFYSWQNEEALIAEGK